MYMVKPLYRRIPNTQCRRNEGNRNSPLEHHSNDDYRQDPWMNTIIRDETLRKKQDICISSKYLLQYLLISVVVLMYVHKSFDLLPPRR